MVRWLKSIGFISICLFVCTACVGPTTPFGALNVVKPVQKQRNPDSLSEHEPYKIRFHPERQVLHDKFDFSIEVLSLRPLSDNVKFQMSYNDLDIGEVLNKNAIVHKSSDGRKILYMFKDVRLKTLDLNEIRVQVLDDSGRGLATEFFDEPDCTLFEKKHLARVGEYHAPLEYIPMIENVAKEQSANPNFLAGVVAQESNFNPKAVSWAKAIGLTQITPLAEEHVIPEVGDWPRYPGINDLSYLTLKSKIYLGEIDDQSEWRLNPEKSLRGGLTYFQYLKNYWEMEANRQIVDSLGGDRDRVLTDLILASYNSGAARVKQAIQTYQHRWKEHESLKEAVHYLKRVNSYCYHFTKKEVQDDNET